MTLEEDTYPTVSGSVRRAAMPSSRPPDSQASVMTSGLAWCNIAVGLSQLVAPDALARLIGLRPSHQTRLAMRATGIRELTTGYALLANSQSTAWLWSRLAGDALDLSLLAAGVGRRADDRTRATRAAFAIAGGAVVSVYAAARTGQIQRRLLIASSAYVAPKRVVPPVSEAFAPAVAVAVSEMADDAHVALPAMRTAYQTITVSRPAADLYAFWRDFGNLPSFMHQLESVLCADCARSHWVMRGPGGTRHAWEAEVVADVPGELIAWQMLSDAAAFSAATVRFVPTASGRDTMVHLTLDYSASAGALGDVVARLFGVEPSQQLERDLAAFKRLMEVAEGEQAESRNVPRDAAPLKADDASPPAHVSQS